MDTPFLVGDEIYLRKVQRKDLNQEYLRWLNDPEVTQYIQSGRFPINQEELEAEYEEIVENDDTVFFAICDRETEEHIGNIKLGPIDWIHRTSSFGTLIGNKDYWGEGVGTEAMELLMQYAFDNLNLWKLRSSALSTNEASLKKNEKAGLKQEAVLEDEYHYQGEYVDKVFVSITRDEYYDQREEA